MRVLFATFGNRERGSTRYRVYNMIPFLEEAGIDPELREEMGSEALKAVGENWSGSTSGPMT